MTYQQLALQINADVAKASKNILIEVNDLQAMMPQNKSYRSIASKLRNEYGTYNELVEINGRKYYEFGGKSWEQRYNDLYYKFNGMRLDYDNLYNKYLNLGELLYRYRIIVGILLIIITTLVYVQIR